MPFVHLNVYSGYSFLKSGLTVRRIVSHALKENEAYVGIADISSFRAAPELLDLCKGRNLKPLIGITFLLDEGKFVCYVKDEEGYRNALTLLHESETKELNLQVFLKHLEGLIVLLDASSFAFKKKALEQKEELASYLSNFASLGDRFYIGLPQKELEPELADAIHSFVEEYPYRLIALPFVAYGKEEEAITLSILEALEEGDSLDIKTFSGPYHFLNQKEAETSFTKEEIDATSEVASLCSSFAFVQKRGGLLRYPLPEGETDAKEYLRKRSYQGLKEKGLDQDPCYIERLEHELKIISSMGYEDYFLIVGDYVNYAKSHGILVGPGRGSGAGSLVSFSLGIVKPDPLKYDLLFERFLNPERHEMPDIDIDFEDTRRENVIAYLQEKYGVDHVARIMTTQTLGARQSLLDIGRIFGYKPSDIRLLSSRLDPFQTLAWNARNNFEFGKLLQSDPYYKEIVSLAFKIEGLPRQAGLHAAGIVLDRSSLPSVAPIVNNDSYGQTIQFDKDYLQDQGFLKFDLLGLTNLSLISHILETIEKSKGIHLNYESLPIDDPKAIELIAETKTMGLFQLESPGMNRAISEIHPTSFEDVAAIIALYRPGPMEGIPTYAKRKKGLEKVTYPCPELEPILSSTYGIIVYQEQIMQIARNIAGFAYGEADIFRRAISHKNQKELASLKESFLKGSEKMGHSKETGEKLFALIEKFASYGFNKSHAISYAMLSCQMAYLKAHYPKEFYCALLDYGGGGKGKLERVLSEIKKSRIHFLLPDVNLSTYEFLPEEGGIRFPLSSIHGLAGRVMEALIDDRAKKGPYQDFFSFCLRLAPKGLDQENLIRLINAGAFDALEPRRASLRLSSPEALRYGSLFGDENGLLSSYPAEPPLLKEIQERRDENLMLEKEALGLMISGSPLENYEAEIKEKGLHSLDDLFETNASLNVACFLSSIKVIQTKRGKKMAFLTLEDGLTLIEGACFEDCYNQGYPYLKEGNALNVKAHKDLRKQDSFLIEEIAPLKGN